MQKPFPIPPPSHPTGFNAAPAFLFLYNHTWIPLVATALYLAFCYAGPELMKERKYVPFSENRTPFACLVEMI